jgi:hypothetical protein
MIMPSCQNLCGYESIGMFCPGKSVMRKLPIPQQHFFGSGRKVTPHFNNCPFGDMAIWVVLSGYEYKNTVKPVNVPFIGKWR